MVKDRKRKANKLSKEKQLTIAKYRTSHPECSYAELAQRYNATANQARYACERYSQGRIGTVHEKKVAVIEAKKRQVMADKKSTNEMLRELVADTVAEIKVQSDLPVDKKAALLQKLTAAAHRLLESDITTQIKNPDAKRVAAMVRLLKPGISDEQLIELWKRSAEITKIK